ncbi:hypothetical protein BH23GEM7_BH23GEM7_25050 [soil metagenome]
MTPATQRDAPPRPAAELVFPEIGEMGRLCREMDWAATPLGPVEEWPQSLRTAAGLVIGHAFPSIVLWGPDLIQIYNDGYIPVHGAKHPWGLGMPTSQVWPEVWHLNEPLFERALRGEQVGLKEALYSLARRGPDAPPDDVYVDLSFSPILDESGSVGGVLVTLIDATAEVENRRLQAEEKRLLAAAERARAELQAANARLRALAESMPQIVWSTRPDGYHDYFNKRWYAYTGMPRPDEPGGEDEVPQGWNWKDYLHPDDHERAVAVWQHSLDTGTAYEIEYRFRSAETGEYRWFLGRALPQREADGRIVRWFGTCTDIHERHQAEAERDRLLAATLLSEERYALVSRATNDVIWDWDLATDELLWNETLETTFGYPHDAVPPTIEFWYQHIHPEDREHVVESIHTALDDGSTAWSCEYRFVQADGSHVTVLDRGAIARDESGRATRMIGSMLDISERERLLASERAARADAEAANRSKSEFLAAMSHELRTPLNAIGGYVDLLDLGIHGPLTEAQRGALSRVTANQRHLLTLINDILSYARLEAGQIEFDLRPLAACDLLTGMEPLIAPLARAKGVALSIRACDPAIRLLGDEERVRQILLNLLGNAVKFNESGGWVLLSCEMDAAGVDLSVRDNGPGIEEEKQQRIFDAFIQVDRRLNRPQEGVGLGLAISRDLARAMGGELRVESTPGEGSTFKLRLPLAPQP